METLPATPSVGGQRRRRILLRYLFGAVMVALAFGIKLLLEPVTGNGAPFVLFFGAVVVTSLWSGAGPGLFATLMSLPLGGYLFTVRGGYAVGQTAAQAALFSVDGFVVVYLSLVMTRARRAAESAEARQRELLDLAPDAFFLADGDGRFTDVNQAACRLLGYEREALIGKRVADIIPPEDQARLENVRAALMVPGQSDRAEWNLIRSDHVPVAVEVSANILSGERWQAFVRDIGERKRADRALRVSEEEQRFLAEAGALLSRSLDFEETLTTLGELMVRDLADWCIVDVIEEDNRPRRLKVVTLRPGGQPLAAHLEQLRIDRGRPHLAKSVLETGQPFLIERMTPETLVSVTQSQEHLRLLRAVDPRSVMGVPLVVRGDLRGVLVLMSCAPSRSYGLPDLRRAEALAERASLAIENGRLYQTALGATQLRDEVLGVVAHDLRNPVAAIMMQASALKRRGGAPERRNPKPAEIILRAATRVNRLISDLLDVRLIESGELGLESARLPAGQLVSDAVEAQRPLLASASLELRTELTDGVPDVWGDLHRLLQVLQNLLGNAIKFTPAGGRVIIGAAPRGSDVLFWVADTGCGISAEGLPHVFDHFWQARKGHHGAGLGLPIARGVVEAHGGQIWVESTLGRGTIVFFTVPQVQAAQAESEPRGAPH